MRVIENHVAFVREPREPGRDEVVVGWGRADEHGVDVQELRLREMLKRVLEARPAIRVETIGIALDLGPSATDARERLSCATRRTSCSGFDIGLAPLADIRFNRARSNIKVKEYAMLGVAVAGLGGSVRTSVSSASARAGA